MAYIDEGEGSVAGEILSTCESRDGMRSNKFDYLIQGQAWVLEQSRDLRLLYVLI